MSVVAAQSQPSTSRGRAAKKFAFEPHTLIDLARVLNAPDPSDDARIRCALGFSNTQGQDAASKLIEPERRLMVAMLKDAVDIVLEHAASCPRASEGADRYMRFRGYQSKQRRRALIEATSWFFDPVRDLSHLKCDCIDCMSDRSWIFSFENVCSVLGLNASYVRRCLKLAIKRARYYRDKD